MTISKAHLPPCLRGKLEFGNREQINALKQLQRDIEAQERFTKKVKDGELKKWIVEVDWRGSSKLEVWAADKKEAEKIACDMDCEPEEWDYDGCIVWEASPPVLP